MLYKELVSYEAIEIVNQLKASSDTEKAKELVRSYVISEEMMTENRISYIPFVIFWKEERKRSINVMKE